MKKISQKMAILYCLVIASFIMPAAAMAVHITPEVLGVGTMFNGEDVLVSGEIAADEDVIVQVIGNASEAEFKQTGKVGGLFWMTVGHLAISNAPSAYFVYLPESISKLRQNKDERWTKLQFDYDSLLSQVKIEPEPDDKDKVFNDFMELKSHDGLYQVVENGIIYEKGTNGEKLFRARIHVPAKMPVAQYQIKVVRVKNDSIANIEQGKLSLEEVGFPLLISNLAFNYSLIYGALAVIIAIFAGLFMGVIFQQKGGEAH